MIEGQFLSFAVLAYLLLVLAVAAQQIALLTSNLFGTISVINEAFGNGHLLIAVAGAVALAFVAWQRWQSRQAASV